MPVVVVFGERESEDALAVRTRGAGQSTRSLEELLADLERDVAAGPAGDAQPLMRRFASPLQQPRRAATLSACKVGAVTLTSGATGCAGSTESNDEGNGAAACQRFLTF